MGYKSELGYNSRIGILYQFELYHKGASMYTTTLSFFSLLLQLIGGSSSARVYLRLQNTYEWKVSVALGKIEPVADDEGIGDLETKVVGLRFYAAAARLIEERHDFDAGRLARADSIQQVMQSQSSVDNIFDDKYVPTFDVRL